MKKILLTVILLLFYISINAATYYVAPSTATPAGNDAAVGDITHPWLTWSKAFSTAVAGDTVFFRGGIYPQSRADGGGERGFNSGTAGNPICFFNFPGEEPILDCSNITNPPYNFNKGITNWDSDYLSFKGLIVRNVSQNGEDVVCSGMEMQGMSNVCDHLTFENIKLYNIGGMALVLASVQYATITNCDFWNNDDHYSSVSPGGTGNGVHWNNCISNGMASAITSELYFYNCRAWRNSDNGFAGISDGYLYFENCWAFDNGNEIGDYGDGAGWKLGGLYESGTTHLNRTVINCLAAYNGITENTGSGFSENNYNQMSLNMHLYNNTSYKNGVGYIRFATLDEKELNWYRNNISYDDIVSYHLGGGYGDYEHEYNSWETPPGVTITDDDFVSVDSTGISGARQSDGTLPELNFLRLAEGSDLIDVGIDVDLPYTGSAPDLGAFEYADEDDTPVVIKGMPVIHNGKYLINNNKIVISDIN